MRGKEMRSYLKSGVISIAIYAVFSIIIFAIIKIIMENTAYIAMLITPDFK